MITDEIFELVSYDVDQEAHITVNREVCQQCTHRACTFTCPARCYEWNEGKRGSTLPTRHAWNVARVSSSATKAL